MYIFSEGNPIELNGLKEGLQSYGPIQRWNSWFAGPVLYPMLDLIRWRSPPPVPAGNELFCLVAEVGDTTIF